MSQNKTVIQGLEPSDSPTRNAQGGFGSNFYTRSERPARGTVISGMTPGGNNPNPGPGGQQPTAHQPAANNVVSGKPVVGFLYSISRTAAGEYWPLHIGQNTIGQSTKCDIILPEGTVSAEHAVLVVRKLKKPEKVIASISDARSTNGTMLNGESLEFAAVECKNGDVITFGDNYELFLILIDPSSIGLQVNPNFIPVSVEEDEDEFGDAPEPFFERDKTRPGEDFGSIGGPTPPPFSGGYSPQGGTVGLDGSSNNNKGGTVSM